MHLSSKIALSFIMVVVLTTGVLLGIIAFEKQSLQHALSKELKHQIQLRTAEVLQPIYKLCEIKEAQTIPLLQKDLDNASYLLSRMGGMSLGADMVPWKIINGKKNRDAELPMMLAGGVWLGQVLEMDSPSPIVDDIHDLSGVHCSIFQRVNRQGDMLNVGTSMHANGLRRAVGTYVAFKNPDGTRNKMIEDILEGKSYLERASYANSWISMMCEPIHSIETGKVIGSLCVSRSQKDTVEALRKIILKTAIGKSGYTWALGSKKERRGVYIISKDGARDGENLWDFQDDKGQYFVRSIVQKALQGKEGEIHFYRYPWKNPGDPQPRMKIAAFTYFEPWDWIIGSSAYEDDFQDTQIRVDTTLGNMLYLTTAAGLALVLCSILAGYIVRRTIMDFTQEREQQNWLKTNLNELSKKIRGEQEVYPLAMTILDQLKASLDATIGVIYQKQAPDLLFPLATYGVANPDQAFPAVKIGEGFVGQAVLNKQTLFVKDVPETYEKICTGVGDVLPKNIIIKPLMHEREVMGAVQLGSLMPFNDIQRAFVEEAGKAIAIAIYTAQSRAKVDDLLAQTQKQAKDLERTSSYKSDFLARMSHEIRTPLNAVTGLTNIVLKSNLTAEQRNYLNKVQLAGSNLLHVINDILDFSKVEAGQLDLEQHPFELDQRIQQLSDLFSDQAAQKDLELVFTTAPQVPRQLTGDAGRLTQVLTNLIGNAIKFTETGEVVVKVDLDDAAPKDQSQAALQFQVSDTGVGIAADVLPTLFEPFTQADSYLTRKHEGTGLGLAICRRLVELMGGRIWAESSPGKGSTFSFTVMLETRMEMPEAMAALREQEPAALPIQRLTGHRVLVVEDSELNRDVAVALLEEVGLAVEIAENGKVAADKVTESPGKYYDAVLMDIQMPIMDGYQATRQIREWESQQTETTNQKQETRIPIIALTAHALKGEKEKCLAADMDDYLSKPLNERDLYRMLVKWITPQQKEADNAIRLQSRGTSDDQGVLDVQGALKRLGGRKQLYGKLLKKFESESAKVHAIITQHIATSDTEAASRMAHTVKGTAAAIGAENLSKVAAEIEKSIRDEVPGIDSLLKAFQSELEQTLKAVDGFLATEKQLEST